MISSSPHNNALEDGCCDPVLQTRKLRHDSHCNLFLQSQDSNQTHSLSHSYSSVTATQKGPDLGLLVSGHLEVRPSATGPLDKAGWLPLNAVPGCTETLSLALDLVDGKTMAGWVGRAPCRDPSSGGKTPGVLKLALANRGQAPDPAGCSLPAGSAGPAQLETMALASASRRKQLTQEDRPGAGAGVTGRGLCCIQTPQLVGVQPGPSSAVTLWDGGRAPWQPRQLGCRCLLCPRFPVTHTLPNSRTEAQTH